MSTDEFWQALDEATNPTAYKPLRNPHIVVSRLQNRAETYYVIKEPEIPVLPAVGRRGLRAVVADERP
jgi:hypothetical protein